MGARARVERAHLAALAHTVSTAGGTVIGARGAGLVRLAHTVAAVGRALLVADAVDTDTGSAEIVGVARLAYRQLAVTETVTDVRVGTVTVGRPKGERGLPASVVAGRFVALVAWARTGIARTGRARLTAAGPHLELKDGAHGFDGRVPRQVDGEDEGGQGIGIVAGSDDVLDRHCFLEVAGRITVQCDGGG